MKLWPMRQCTGGHVLLRQGRELRALPYSSICKGKIKLMTFDGCLKTSRITSHVHTEWNWGNYTRGTSWFRSTYSPSKKCISKVRTVREQWTVRRNVFLFSLSLLPLTRSLTLDTSSPPYCSLWHWSIRMTLSFLGTARSHTWLSQGVRRALRNLSLISVNKKCLHGRKYISEPHPLHVTRGSRSPGLLRRVVWWLDTDVSEDRVVSIFTGVKTANLA
jgi:hypothetical protein